MKLGTMLPLAIVVAIAENGVIGLRGGLPWNHPEDRAHFLKLTEGHAVIMGRRTFEETNRPLERCRNIVVSRHLSGVGGIEVIPTLAEAISLARTSDFEPFVIGGVRLFKEALRWTTTIWLTEIPGSPAGDVFFYLDRTGFVVRSKRTNEAGLVFLELVRG